MIFNTFWVLAMLAEACVIARLALSGMWRHYPALVLFAALDLGGNAVGLWAVVNQQSYRAIYWIIEPGTWIAEALLVIEIWRKWARGYVNMGRFGVALVAFFALLSVASSLSLADYDYSHLSWSGDMLEYYLIRRGLYTALATFLFLAIAFTNHFGVDVSANLRRHTWISAGLFAALSVQTFLLNVGAHRWMEYSQDVLVFIYAAGFFAWAALLTPEGEIVIRTPKIDPEKLARFEEIERSYLGGLRSATGAGTRAPRSR